MYNYNPYYPQFGQQNSIYPQNQFIQNQQNPGMEVVPVPTIQQVEQVGLQPGQRKMVMVQNEPSAKKCLFAITFLNLTPFLTSFH